MTGDEEAVLLVGWQVQRSQDMASQVGEHPGMQTEVVVALIGLPVTALGAAIAYPVGRGVARRQAADQHAQWLRAERRNATQAHSDAATKFIEAFRTSWEEIGRPAYAHTRRRDIELRKRLDPALYEPLKRALESLHSAGAVVALHGPERVTVDAEGLYVAALDATSRLLRFDAANVCRSIELSSLKQDESSQQHIQAALDDLDRAFARLAAPLGLPEYPTEIEMMLRTAAAAGAGIQFLQSINEPDVARGALRDLRHSLEDATEEMQQALGPLLGLEPLVEFSALTAAVRAGDPVAPERLLSLLSLAMPALINMFSGMRDQTGMLRELLTEVDEDPVLNEAVQAVAGYTENLSEPVRILQQMHRHFELGDELVATEAPLPTAVAWVTALHPLTESLNASTAQTEARMPLMSESLRPLFDRQVDEANTSVRCELDRVIQARVEFLHSAREAIDLP
ncbi:hypothetical protein ACFWWA_23840 [Streptomyces goshikiensis]|uniref:hypothetical protein n=1 Tax=Streptomyces goshikiensis TaxID=1942 RepID=UPI003666E015